MKYFPLFFDLTGQRVLVVGAGSVALRKVQSLARAHAAITVVAPEVAPELARLAAAGQIEVSAREFAPEDLEGRRLVIVATSKRALNRWIASLCEARAIPVNVVDDRRASRVIVPAIVDRDPVIVAVSSAGTSPSRPPPARAARGAAAAAARPLGFLAGRDPRRRAAPNPGGRCPQTLFRDARGRRRRATLRRGRVERGARRIAQQLMAASALPMARGEVALVGAGPGDPELLTLKALRALQDADVIMHDRLVPPALLEYSRRDAELICVGKAAGGGGMPQESINQLLIEHARRGRRVVRLKGGDPFMFGRGGEELEALVHARVRFSVIPGISAANGCAAYAGIPLTHRGLSHSVSFVTGHAEDEDNEPDWAALARPRSTAVFYMGLARLERIVTKLMQSGAPADRPAALIAQGTTANQQVVIGTLATLAGQCGHIESPALLVVGEVAALHEALAWFGDGAARELRSQSA